MPKTYRFDPSDYEGLKYTCRECGREFPSHDALDKEGHCVDCHRTPPNPPNPPKPGVGDMASRLGPWASTLLPIPEIMFECPGEDWHMIAEHRPWEMQWMQSVSEDISSDWPEDDFYCRSCIFSARWAAEKAGLSPDVIVTGPTLEEEFKLRGLAHLAEYDGGRALMYP